ncbi:MAG TPA: hypothetical protein VFF69_09175 [Phycisphaerales bacterium]|nr:hypothetical protein [Phycisphaerales bacterium]
MTGAAAHTGAASIAPTGAVAGHARDPAVGSVATTDIPWALLGALALVALGAALIAWWINHRFNGRRPARERAFIRMARMLGLDRETRALVKDLAAECDMDPLTLLVSPGAMQSTLIRIDRERWRDRRGWKKLAALGATA